MEQEEHEGEATKLVAEASHILNGAEYHAAYWESQDGQYALVTVRWEKSELYRESWQNGSVPHMDDDDLWHWMTETCESWEIH